MSLLRNDRISTLTIRMHLNGTLLSKHVSMLKEGKSMNNLLIPILLVLQSETIHIENCVKWLLKGFLPFAIKKLRNMMDLKIFVDADPDERLIRVIQRDAVNADVQLKLLWNVIRVY